VEEILYSISVCPFYETHFTRPGKDNTEAGAEIAACNAEWHSVFP
jgi:hypothetical protein